MPLISAWSILFCCALFMFLTAQVVRARRASGVALGDGGDKTLLRRIRGQANAAEQMPITLLALAMAELIGGTSILLFLAAALFLGGRLAHGICFGLLDHSPRLRFWGMLASLIGSLSIMVIFGLCLLAATFT